MRFAALARSKEADVKKLSEIEKIVQDILGTQWSRRAGQVLPTPENVTLGNDAVEVEGAVLYADLADSTGLVSGYKDWFAAEIYKSYLSVACELIRNNGGAITAFDGDRVMAVYMGNNKNSAAAKTALQINYVVKNVINPKIKLQYPKTSYEVKQAVGVDASKLFVAKTGIHGFNDLVWVGKAANNAAKLCSMRDGGHSSFISKAVHGALNEASKFGKDQQPMWDEFIFPETGEVAYRSTWWWKPD